MFYLISIGSRWSYGEVTCNLGGAKPPRESIIQFLSPGHTTHGCVVATAFVHIIQHAICSWVERTTIMMRSTASNQSRRSTSNRRDRQPTTPTNQKPQIGYVPKLKYVLSTRTVDGVLVVSSRKRAPSTDEERTAKKQRNYKCKQK